MFTNTRSIQRQAAYSTIRGSVPKSRLLSIKNFIQKPVPRVMMREPLREEGRYDRTDSDLEEKWADQRIIVAGCQGQIGVPLVRELCQ